MNTSLTMSQALVRLEKKAAIATLTLKRTEMQNALIPELLEAVLAALAEIHHDDSIRVVVLAAEGPAFSIGGDMRRFVAEGRLGKANLLAYSARLVGRLNETVLAMINLPQPIIGAVHGTVTGGSIGFVGGCDLMVLADNAVFKAHYATAGYCPDGGWTSAIADLIGTRRTAAALLLNRSISASEALNWGLATELAPTSEVLARAQALAARIAAYPIGTMHYAKRLLASESATLAARLEGERRGFLDLIGSDDALQGMERFLESFTGYPGAAE